MSNISILKFDNSILQVENDYACAVHAVYESWRRGEQVLALVANTSAASAFHLGLGLEKAGIPFQLLDPTDVGLRIREGEGASESVRAEIEGLRTALRRTLLVVLPVAAGPSCGDLTTLQENDASDLTALFLTHYLGGSCVLFKEVKGLYKSQPRQASLRSFSRVTWQTARGLSDVHANALRFAESHSLSFRVMTLGTADSTEVCAGPDLLITDETTRRAPLAVALLGCGTVGGGVYQHLIALPELFTLTGVARSATRTTQIPKQLVSLKPEELIGRRCDVVVELIGGRARAGELTRQALRLGRHVVTANKALMAMEGEQLGALASEEGVSLRYSAAVGGGLPAIETIARLRARGAIEAFWGVLNGTSNFVLDRVAAGDDFARAVRAAQSAGYAEADPSLDLDGTDAAQKLVILARLAFDAHLTVSDVRCEGIDRVDPEWIRTARAAGHVVRLVASCKSTENGLEASVTPSALSLAHPLGLTAGVQNSLLVECEGGGSYFVSAGGAGRWPTAESVLADLLDLRGEISGEHLFQNKPTVWGKNPSGVMASASTER